MNAQSDADRWRDYVAEPMRPRDRVRVWQPGRNGMDAREVVGTVTADGQGIAEYGRPGIAYRAGAHFTCWRPVAMGPVDVPSRLVFLVDNGESYDDYRKFEIDSDLEDGLHLTLADVQAIAQVQQCKVFAWVLADEIHWLDGDGVNSAGTWIDLSKFAHMRWPEGLPAPTYWLQPDVAELPADLLEKVIQASAASLRDGELRSLRQHLDDVRAGRAPTVPIHLPDCAATRDGDGGEQLKCDCGYEWPRGKD